MNKSAWFIMRVRMGYCDYLYHFTVENVTAGNNTLNLGWNIGNVVSGFASCFNAALSLPKVYIRLVILTSGSIYDRFIQTDKAWPVRPFIPGIQVPAHPKDHSQPGIWLCSRVFFPLQYFFAILIFCCSAFSVFFNLSHFQFAIVSFTSNPSSSSLIYTGEMSG